MLYTRENVTSNRLHALDIAADSRSLISAMRACWSSFIIQQLLIGGLVERLVGIVVRSIGK